MTLPRPIGASPSPRMGDRGLTFSPATPMPYAMAFDRSLALAPQRAPYVIRRIPFEGVRAFCAARGLREGDQVQRQSSWTSGPLVIETAAGARVELPIEYAALIECEPG
jgi:hypothetical protein